MVLNWNFGCLTGTLKLSVSFPAGGWISVSHDLTPITGPAQQGIYIDKAFFLLKDT